MSEPPVYPGLELRLSSPPIVGETVLAIQQRLGELGFACADIGGAEVPKAANGAPLADIAALFGSRTAAAVRDYQGKCGLRQNGVIDLRTWAAIFGAPPAAAPEASPVAPQRPKPIDVEERDTDFAKLHPAVRGQVSALVDALTAEGIPMRVFEAYRTPERQQHLFSKGRNAAGAIIDKRAVVTRARPFESYHQYGLAVDVVINKPGVNPWETGTEEARGWWRGFHDLADQHGLEPLSWEMPHVQMKGLTTAGMLRGDYPDGGDEGWVTNLSEAIDRWQGVPKPPRPSAFARPPLAKLPPGPGVSDLGHLDWDSLPRVAATDWSNPHGGQRWRVDQRGVYIESEGGGTQPLRSLGVPRTCSAIVEMFGAQIHKFSARHQVPAELIVMTIATEAGIYRAERFTGPKTFRWEAGVTDYSAGPMQILSGTARGTNKQAKLGYDDGKFPAMADRPAQPPVDLALYDPEVAIDVGAALIRRIIDGNGTNPILVAAAYNAGSVRPSDANPWKIKCFGDHLDRAAQWYGDACEVIEHLRS